MAEEDQVVPQEPEDTQSAADASGAAGSPQPEAPADPKAKAAADALAAAKAAISQLNAEEASGTAPQPPASEPAAASDPVPAGKPATDGAKGFDLPSLSLGGSSELPDGISLLKDVNLDVKIELGRTRMVVDDVLRLSEGAVVELDKLAGDPVDIYVNGRHIARGEVLVLNENFCVRISEILAGAEAAAKQIATAAADALSA